MQYGFIQYTIFTMRLIHSSSNKIYRPMAGANSQAHEHFDLLYGKPELWELMQYANVSSKWRLMGVALRLDGRVLNEIESNNNDVNTMLEKMYNKWLERQTKASRQLVLNALRSNIIKENVLADKYEEDLRTGISKFEIKLHVESYIMCIVFVDPPPTSAPPDNTPPSVITLPPVITPLPVITSTPTLCTCRCDTFCKLGKYICKHLDKLVNYLLSIGFVAIFIPCIVVIATIGSLQSDISCFFINNTILFDCYLFADCGQDGSSCNFQLNSYSCGILWAAYTLIGTVSLGLAISSVVKAVIKKRSILLF